MELDLTAQSLKKNGFNVDKLFEHIQGLSDDLVKIEEAIEAKNLDTAEHHLRAIDETLNNIYNNLRQRMQEHNRHKVLRYQTALVNRYDTMKTTLTFVQSIDNDRVTNVLSEMESIENKLNEARRLNTEGRTAESVRVLYLANQDFKHTFSGINGDETIIILNSLDRLTAQLENEISLRERMRIQMEIDKAKQELKNRLEQNSITANHQHLDGSNNTNSTSLAS
jgi:uncharacterized protein YecT (DUF1311 family)